MNALNGKTAPYKSKGVLRRYNYRSDPKLAQKFVDIRMITCSCHTCTTTLCLSWDYKIKYARNQPRYERVYDCKYSLIIGSHNNWIIINFIDDGTYEREYDHINIKILDSNVTDISSIISEGTFCAIDADRNLCHG